VGGRGWLSLAVGISAIFFLAGCSSNSSTTNPPPSGTVPVNMTIHDTPPSGVTILSFEVKVTGASLQPADSTQAAVSLLSAPEEIELEHLQTSSALLSATSVAAGTYNSLEVTFANPQMTILNDTGATLTVGGKSCANGQVCEVDPTLNQASVTVTSTPFPLTLAASAPVSLKLDFNIQNSVQSDLSITPAVSVTTATTPAEQDQEDIELTGAISAVDSSNHTFTMTVAMDGQTDTIATDTNTEFDFEHQGCTANDFSCLSAGEVVKVEARTNNGTLTAKDVEGLAVAQGQMATGTVVSVDSTLNQFHMVLLDIEADQQSQTLSMGMPVTVTLQSGATFQVNAGGISLGGLTFSGMGDLMAGQEVAVSIAGVQAGTSGLTLTSDQVTLETSQVFGTVGTVDTSQSSFTLTNLTGLFTGAGVTQIQVQTGSNTQFEDVSGLGALTQGQLVSAGGLLLRDPNNANQAVLLATAVRLRQD
jgi:hypothetical protein